MKKTALRKKWASFVLGFAFAFLFLELALRIIGYVNERSFAEESATPGAVFTILCLGNSHTAGTGAPDGESFPAQLQRMIDKLKPQVPVKVVNRGRGNFNTTNILNSLDKNLSETNANLVVLMPGQPNAWNRFGYGKFLEKTEGPFTNNLMRAWSYVHDKLYFLKTFRLFSHLTHGGTPQNLAQSNSLEKGDPLSMQMQWMGLSAETGPFQASGLNKDEADHIIQNLKKLVAQVPDYRPAYERIARIYLRSLHNPESSLEWYEKSLDVGKGEFSWVLYDDLRQSFDNPKPPRPDLEKRVSALSKRAGLRGPDKKTLALLDSYFTSGSNARGPLITAMPKGKRLDFMLLANKVHPCNDGGSLSVADFYSADGQLEAATKTLVDSISSCPFRRHALAQIKQYIQQSPEADNIWKQFQEDFRKKYPNRMGWLDSDNTKTVSWIRSDLLEITRVLKARGIPLVLQTYIPNADGTQRLPDSAIREIARQGSYPLADNSAAFMKLFSQIDDHKKYYESWNGHMGDHPSAEGYRIVAEVLLEVLQKNGLIK